MGRFRRLGGSSGGGGRMGEAWQGGLGARGVRCGQGQQQQRAEGVHKAGDSLMSVR